MNLSLVPIALVGALPMWFGLPYLYKKYKQYELQKACAEDGILVLTYDDGPSPTLTPRLLKLLEDQGVRATFFPLGRRVADHGDITRELAEHGHEIGCHSHLHLNAWKKSPVAVWRDIVRGHRTLEAIGIAPRLFRPPHGKTTPSTLLQIRVRGGHQCFWTLDSGDTFRQQTRLDALLRRLQASRGGVVLMHDHERPNDRPREDHVYELTAALINLARREKWTLLTMGELLNRVGDRVGTQDNG